MCSLCPDGDIDSFNTLTASDPDMGPLEKLFQTEEATTTRYILSGRRWGTIISDVGVSTADDRKLVFALFSSVSPPPREYGPYQPWSIS